MHRFDSPLQAMLAEATERGFFTFQQVDEYLPNEGGDASLIDCVVMMLEETGLLPHLNPGTMTIEQIRQLREVSPSMGIMLESSSKRLCEKGQPHFGSPDKDPELRLMTIRAAGKASVPLTTGILIGIGETRQERIESLLAIKEVHLEFDHIQEIIVQNFIPKADTKMTKIFFHS